MEDKISKYDKSCLWFAKELVKNSTRFKENRKNSEEILKNKSTPKEVKYFIPSGSLKELLKNARKKIRFFIPISVGQYYHVGAYAESQIACVDNLRESCAQWYQEQITQKSALKDKNPVRIEYSWSVEFLPADTLQALNRVGDFGIDSGQLEIDLSQPPDQCIKLLQLKNDKRTELEKGFSKDGKIICDSYRTFFSQFKKRQSRLRNVRLNFNVCPNDLSWEQLQLDHYHDPNFVMMVNYLEGCFKHGAKMFTTGSPTCLADEVIIDWQKNVKVNDIAYMIAEFVMQHYVIFRRSPEDEHRFVLYPGPVGEIFGRSKELLAIKFGERLDMRPRSFLYTQSMSTPNKQVDPDAELFIGHLSPDSTSSEVLRDRRQSFIRKTFSNTSERLEIRDRFQEEKLKKQERHEQRKVKKFDDGEYRQFLDKLPDEYSKYSSVIDKLVINNELPWSNEDPLECIIMFFRSFLSITSLTSLSTTDMYFITNFNSVWDKLDNLREKARKTSPKRRQEHLKCAACYLVEAVISMQKCYEKFNILATPESESNNNVWTNFFSFFSSNKKSDVNNKLSERFIAGTLFFLNRLTTGRLLDVSSLKDYRYFQDDYAEIEYLSSTQESTSSSLGGGGAKK